MFALRYLNQSVDITALNKYLPGKTALNPQELITCNYSRAAKTNARFQGRR